MALFESRRESNSGRKNLVEAYSRVGGVVGALAHAAEDVRQDKLSEDERQLLEAVLARLVTLGGTGGATRRVAGREEFDEAKRTLAERLTTEHCGRLLLAGANSVEICHEQLVTQWPWVAEPPPAGATDMRRLAHLDEQISGMVGGSQSQTVSRNGQTKSWALHHRL
jgi:hypothetical protein